MSITISPVIEEVAITVDPETENVLVSITETAVSIPTGGTDGQVLAKASDVSYDLEWVDQQSGPGGNTDWGDIDGTLSNQTDLQQALDNKVDKVTGKSFNVFLFLLCHI